MKKGMVENNDQFLESNRWEGGGQGEEWREAEEGREEGEGGEEGEWRMEDGGWRMEGTTPSL